MKHKHALPAIRAVEQGSNDTPRCPLRAPRQQEALGERPSVSSNPANSVCSAAHANSSKKPGKCIGRTAGEVENPRKTAIMSLFGRGKVSQSILLGAIERGRGCEFISCWFVIQVTEVIKERKYFRGTFYQHRLHGYKPQHF